jgi:hypothetical protein
VAEQFLYRADVVALFQQVGGKGMTEGVSTGWRLPWKKMYPLIQWMYAFSVRRL